jgi:REP element-mobilizing transposase RayT
LASEDITRAQRSELGDGTSMRKPCNGRSLTVDVASAMTPPRYIVQNQLVFLTCGAIGRSFRFLPTRRVVELLWYVLAVMSQRSRIQIHEVLFMSNHFHVLLTDRDGVLPDFMRDFNSLLSRGLNALRGSTGSNVEKGYNIVLPTDDAKVVEHAIYTLTNPCNAHLVERAAQWPGVTSLGLEYGRSMTFRRPSDGLWKSVADALAHLGRTPRSNASASDGRLRHAGRTALPETVELTLVRPAVMPELSDVALREYIRAEVRRVENDLIIQRRSEGRGVVGMQRVLTQSYTDTPTTSRVLFEMTPRVSGKSRWARLEALARRLAFERAHAVARDAIAEVLGQAHRLGRHLAARLAAIDLPDGAFLLRRRYGCICGVAT